MKSMTRFKAILLVLTFVVIAQGQAVFAAEKESGTDAVSAISKQVREIGGSVLGTATKLVQTAAASAADRVSTFVLDNAVSGLIKQYDKLSDNQKKTIQKYVCK